MDQGNQNQLPVEDENGYGETQQIPNLGRDGGKPGRRPTRSGLMFGVLGLVLVILVIVLLVAVTAIVMNRSAQTLNKPPTPTLRIEFNSPAASPTRIRATVVLSTPSTRPTGNTTVVVFPTVTPASAGADNAQGTSPSSEEGDVRVGGFVEVRGTAGLGVRVRSGPGLNYTTNKIYEEGTRFKVLEGPQAIDDLQWWRLEDPSGVIGWAAGDYLTPVGSAE